VLSDRLYTLYNKLTYTSYCDKNTLLSLKKQFLVVCKHFLCLQGTYSTFTKYFICFCYNFMQIVFIHVKLLMVQSV